MVILDQSEHICTWLESRFTACKNGTPLKELRQFITTRCPVDLQGISLTAEECHMFLQRSFPTAVKHDSGEENLYPFHFKFNFWFSEISHHYALTVFVR